MFVLFLICLSFLSIFFYWSKLVDKVAEFVYALCRVEVFRAGHRTVHDIVAVIQFVAVFFELSESLRPPLVSRVCDPPVRLLECRRAQEPSLAVLTPPVLWARSRATPAQHTLVEPVKNSALVLALQYLALLGVHVAGRVVADKPGLYGCVVLKKPVHVHNKVSQDLEVRERADCDDLAVVPYFLYAGEPVAPVDVHGTGAAHAFAAGLPERERGIKLFLDIVEAVDDHGARLGRVNLVAHEPRGNLLPWDVSVNTKCDCAPAFVCKHCACAVPLFLI